LAVRGSRRLSALTQLLSLSLVAHALDDSPVEDDNMGSSGKPRTTMAKLQRETALRERRLDKAARKRARKEAPPDTSQPDEFDPEAPESESSPAELDPDREATV
jgi:hypothetical protein